MSNHSTAFSETLVDEWVRHGLQHAIIAPGSRSTPLALALAQADGIEAQVVLDERVAAFMALGIGLADRRPALVLTTSGTATTHLHAAVVEAHLAEVPLLVCTADRPPELYGVGAAQTIHQQQLFGGAARAYLELGPPDDANRHAWRSVASRAWNETMGVPFGPVQLNLSFREPLIGAPSAVPPGRSGARPWHRRIAAPAPPPPDDARALAQAWAARTGVIVAGEGIDDAAPVLALAEMLHWPVLAEPRSRCRVTADVVVAHADAVLRDSPTAAQLRPEIILSLGAPPASKVLAGWLAELTAVPDGRPPIEPAEWIVVNRAGTWWDPDRRASVLYASCPSTFARSLLDATPSAMPAAASSRGSWLSSWRRVDDIAAATLAAALAEESGRDGPAPEPLVARRCLEVAAENAAAALVVSSSMPVRDVEWFAPRLPLGAAQPKVFANRGANGIDGVLSTALGVGLAAAPAAVWVLVGDLAFLHDSNALLNVATRPARLRIVVVDNEGGGIFSFLPQSNAVAPELFESLFGTRQYVAIETILAAHGVAVTIVERCAELDPALRELAGCHAPVAAVVVRAPDRRANVALHDRLSASVVAALTRC